MSGTAAEPISIPSERRKGVDGLAGLARAIAGERALALSAFGPGLAPGRERHALDTVLVLAQDDLAALRELGARGRALARERIAPPLILTPEAIERSRDTFPLELLEIAQTRAPVFGDDRLAAVAPAREHLRLQCERELKSLGVAMRQRVLRAGGDGAALGPHELADSAARVLRGLLWLKGAEARRHGSEVVAAAQEALGRPLPAIAAAWSGGGGWEAYHAFYAEVQALGTMVDGW